MFEYQLGMLHKIIIAIIAIFFIVIATNMVKSRNRRRMEFVSKRSRYISEIIEISKLYGINFLLKEKYTRPFMVKSKYAVDNFNFKSKILEDIENNQEMYEGLFKDSANNSDCWEDFIEEISEMERPKPDAGLLKAGKMSEKTFVSCEDDFLQKLLKDRPVQNPEIEYSVRYTTPKGRNSYWASKSIYVDDLPQFFGEIEKLKEYRNSAQYQRQLITPKRRLEIIAKDHGRCCLCGRSVAEGAQLEVDHFIPVSKGGKSTDDNLWTLCRDCNRGKSNYTIEELQDTFDQALAER